MTQPGSAPRSRQQRRKEQTRAALVRAAQALLAAGKTDVPILEITHAADVGMGSFYNHFDSTEQLFQAAVEDALDAHGALLEQLTAGLDDPAEIFAYSFRLTGRLHRRQPKLGKVLLHNALALARSERGLAPRARRDIDAATRAGRFTVSDPELAMTIVAGATLCLGQLLHDQTDRDDAQAADRVTEDLLRMLGVPADEARRICLRPLPDPERSGAPRTPERGGHDHPSAQRGAPDNMNSLMRAERLVHPASDEEPIKDDTLIRRRGHTSGGSRAVVSRSEAFCLAF